MTIKDWYKITFQIESDLEDIIIWKLNELGIFSFSFEYLKKTDNKKEVNIWLPIDSWDKNSRSDFEKIISKLLNIKDSKNQFFNWSIIKEEDWLTSWKKYWAPELIGNHFLILPCWINLNEKFKDKKIIKIDPGAAFGTGSHPSTRLCIEALDTDPPVGKTIADLGCGSGILSLIALQLGAKSTFSVDTDSLAISATKSNSALNNVPKNLLNVFLGSIDELEVHLPEKKIDLGEVKQLASLPSLDELRARILGLINAPAGNIATLLNKPSTNLAQVVKAYSEKGEAA